MTWDALYCNIKTWFHLKASFVSWHSFASHVLVFEMFSGNMIFYTTDGKVSCWIRKTTGGAEKREESDWWSAALSEGVTDGTSSAGRLTGPGRAPPVRPPWSQAPCPLFDLIKGKRANQFHWRCREMTAHKLKESGSAGGGGGGQRSSLTLNTILCAM